MAARKKPRREDATTRIRHLIALDAANVMRRLEARKDEMIRLFSRLRDRAPMVETLHSLHGSITFSDLAQLRTSEQAAINAFYESLEALRWYVRYTEDMPGTVHKTSRQHLRRLQAAYDHLTAAIGQAGEDGAPIVDADVVVHPTHPLRPALPSGARK